MLGKGLESLEIGKATPPPNLSYKRSLILLSKSDGVQKTQNEQHNKAIAQSHL